MLTFSVQSLKLLVEIVDKAADGGSDGPQIEVGVDGDHRPVSNLR